MKLYILVANKVDMGNYYNAIEAHSCIDIDSRI